MAAFHRLGLRAAARSPGRLFRRAAARTTLARWPAPLISDPSQRHFLARYATDRGFLDQEAGLHTAEDAAATANLAVRVDGLRRDRRLHRGHPIWRGRGSVPAAGGCRVEDRAAPRRGRHPPSPRVAARPDGLDRALRGGRPVAERALSGDRRRPGPWCRGSSTAGRTSRANLAGRRFEEAAFRGVDAWACSPTRSATAARTKRSFALEHGTGAHPLTSEASSARTRSATAAASSSDSYFVRGQKKPRRPSFFTRGTTWQ